MRSEAKSRGVYGNTAVGTACKGVSRDIFWVLSCAITYFIVAQFSLQYLFEPEGIAAIWPLSGIFLSAVLLARKKVRPYLIVVLFLTDFVAEMLAGTRVPVSMAYAAALAGDAMLGAWLMIRFAGEPIAFRRTREIIGFLFLSVLLSSALMSVIAVSFTAIYLGTPFWTSWFRWFASGGVGSILVTPLILSTACALKKKSGRFEPRKFMEGSALFLSIAFVSYLHYFHFFPDDKFSFLITLSTFPFLIWASLRFGVLGTSAATIMFAFSLLHSSMSGQFPQIVDGLGLDTIIVIQIHIAMMAIPSLLLASLITERKRVDKALKESEARYRTLVENTGEGIAIVDLEERFVFVNPAGERIFGVLGGNLVGRSLQEFVDPAQFESLSRNVLDRRPGQSTTYQLDIKRPDGRECTITVTTTTQFDKRNKPESSFGIFRDITERKRSEEALRESEGKYRLLAEASADYIFTLNRDLVVEYVNKSGAERWRLTAEEIIGRNIIDLFPTEIYIQQSKVIKEIFETGRPVHSEDLSVFPKSGPTWLDSWLVPIKGKDDRVELVIGVSRNITERKQADEALRESREVLQAILNSIPVRVFWKDRNSRYLGCNIPFARDAGFEKPEDIIGNDDHAMGWREQAEVYVADDRAVIETGEVRLLFEEPQTTPSGERIHLLTSKVPLRDADGTIVGVLGTYQDITDRKRAEEALRTLLSRQEAILDAVPDIIMEVDINKIYSWANQAGFEFFGEDVLGKGAAFYFEDEQDTYAIVQPLFNGGEGVFYVENWQRRKDGQKRLLAWWCRVLRDSNGNVTGALSSAQDITDRKRAEEALRLKNSVFDASIAANSIADLDGVMTEVNDAFLRIWGYPSKAEVIGKPIPHFFNDPDEAVAIVTVLNKTGRWEGDFTAKRKDGSIFIANFQATVLRDQNDRVIGYQSAVIDITDRKRAERAIAQFKMIFDLANFGAVVSDLEGNITYANNYFAQVHGYAVSEVLGRHVSMFHTDEQTKALSKKIETVIREGNIAAIEVGHKHADGHEFPMLQNALLLRNGHGPKILLATTAIDITDRKRMEEERIELERRLLHGQKLESLGVLAGGIAHDFNNLLAAIIGNLSMVADDLPELSENHQAIEQAMLAAKRAADLTKQMLAYSGRGHIMVQKLDLNLLAQENVQMLRAVVPKTITLDIQLSQDMQMILVDASQVQQVVMNLLTNASDAIGEQAGSITLLTGVDYCSKAYLSHSRTENKPEAGMFVWIEVRDTGCGMDEETQKRLFEPFFTTKLTGRGLGMSAVLGIVQGHGGALIIDSKVGTGASLRVLFPVTLKQRDNGSQESITLPEVKSDAKQTRASGTVLVVDDEEMVRAICGASLRRLGYRTLLAVNGEEAIRVLQAHTAEISAVILDLTMPSMDGVTAFKKMLQIKPDLKVILSSGYSEKDAIKGFSGQCPAGFLQKPYELQELKAELDTVLSPGEATRTSVG